jgi:hypothetical protein
MRTYPNFLYCIVFIYVHHFCSIWYYCLLRHDNHSRTSNWSRSFSAMEENLAIQTKLMTPVHISCFLESGRCLLLHLRLMSRHILYRGGRDWAVDAKHVAVSRRVPLRPGHSARGVQVGDHDPVVRIFVSVFGSVGHSLTGVGSALLGDNVDGAWSLPLTSIQCRG